MNESIKFLDNTTYYTITDCIPNAKTCSNLAYFYSIFGDPTRIKVIIALSLCEMCVNDLSLVLGINQTTISHQLKILKSIGAVRVTKKNKYTFYKVTDQFVNSAMLNGIDYIIYRQKGA